MIETNFLLNLIILLVNGVYLYYWIVVAIASSHKHISAEDVSNDNLIYALSEADHMHTPTHFIIQITTKGNCPEVLKRGIENVLESFKPYPVLKRLVKIEVITEQQSDIDYLSASFRECKYISYYLLPTSYETANGTKLKARALQYMVEVHRTNPDLNSYIVHYDEESVFTPINLARLVRRLLLEPKKITEGMISYGLDFDKANIICQAMESNRPFGCHECFLVMKNPPPIHLHGSNLVVEQRLENEIGWDIGTSNGNALVAEDLVFGLKAYLRYGKNIFGWHYTEMIEQPPFTLKAAIKQRERWVFGGLQTLDYLSNTQEWKVLGFLEKLRLKGLIYLRIAIYALGFPMSIVTILLNLYVIGSIIQDIIRFNGSIYLSFWTFLLIPGLFMWLLSIQLGLYYNLRYSIYNKKGKVLKHLQILCISPLAGIFETYGAFKAVTKWNLGIRNLTWIPTPKLNLEKNIMKIRLVDKGNET